MDEKFKEMLRGIIRHYAEQEVDDAFLEKYYAQNGSDAKKTVLDLLSGYEGQVDDKRLQEVGNKFGVNFTVPMLAGGNTEAQVPTKQQEQVMNLAAQQEAAKKPAVQRLSTNLTQPAPIVNPEGAAEISENLDERVIFDAQDAMTNRSIANAEKLSQSFFNKEQIENAISESRNLPKNPQAIEAYNAYLKMLEKGQKLYAYQQRGGKDNLATYEQEYQDAKQAYENLPEEKKQLAQKLENYEGLEKLSLMYKDLEDVRLGQLRRQYPNEKLCLKEQPK